MELPLQTAINASDEHNKDEQSTLLEENVQKPLPKKKFSNTVFATKMRNRKLEEKIKKLDAKEVLSACKPVSVDITRLTSNIVPKLISTVEHKNRKRKRFQWKLGKTKKKKKSPDKNARTKNVIEKPISEKSNKNEQNIETQNLEASDEKEVVKEKHIQDKLEFSVDKDDTQRRKSLRHVTPITFSNEKLECEIKPDTEPAPDEKFSCSRTEPFIGKLNTKEARIQYVDKILREESDQISQNNNEIIDNNRKDLPQKNKNKSLITNQPDSENNKSTENDRITEKSSKNDQTKENEKSVEKRVQDNNKSKKNNKDTINKATTKNATSTLKSTEKELVIQESKKASKKVIETKDVKVEETSCRRTIPFVGKIPRQPPSGVSARPIEIDCCPSNENVNSASTSEDVNAKSSSSPSVVSEKSDSSKDVSAKLESSPKDVKTKIDSCLKSVDVPEPEPEPEPESTSKDVDTKLVPSSKDVHAKLDSINNVSTNLYTSTNNIELKLDTFSKVHPSEKLDVPTEDINMKDMSLKDGVIENSDFSSTEVKEFLNSSNKIETKVNLCNDTKVKPDCSTNTDSVKSVKSLVNNDKKQTWSCRRTEPYLGKDYPNCSRTLPFVRPVNKVQITGTPDALETSRDSLNNSNLIERITDNESLNNADQSMEDLSQNGDSNIPTNQENELDNTITDTATNLADSSKSDVPVQNGEWKFRRKRQKTNSEDETQVEEAHPSKKLKAKSLSVFKIPADRKSTTVPASPDRTICSLLSLNCTKHAHHHNGKCPTSLKIQQEASVVLTRLDQLNDPLAIEYFKKTDLTCETKDSSLPRKNKAESVKPNSSLVNEKQVPPTDEENQTTKDNFTNFSAPTTTVKTNSTVAQSPATKAQDEINQQVEDETSKNMSISVPKTRMRRRTLSRTSTESPNIIHTKRRKHPVNYVESFSDSDTESSASFSISLRTRCQSRGPTLRDRNKIRTYSTQDEDEDDKEVEGFTNDGLRTGVLDSNGDDTEIERPNLRTRAKSRVIGVLEKSQDSVRPLSKDRIEMIQDTPQANLTNEQSARLSSIQVELNKQRPAYDTELDTEIEELSRNYAPTMQLEQALPCSNGLEAESLKSASLGAQPTEFNNNSCFDEQEQSRLSNMRTPILGLCASAERMLSTPKTISKSDSVTGSGRKRGISKAEETSGTPRRVPGTPSQSGRESSLSSRSNNSLMSANYVKNNLLSKLTKSRPNLELPTLVRPGKKEVPLKNLKVQLIKLEAVCSSFEDYSASEIELLTGKYIDLLMNSNFTCDTWHTPINYHRSRGPAEQHVEEIDNSDCVSDIERDEESTPAQEVVDSEATLSAGSVTIEGSYLAAEKSKEATPKKSVPRDQSALTSLETAIATLVDQVEPYEQRNFGAVNISEALSASTSKEKNKERPIESGETETIHEILEVEVPVEQPETILVNGTTMFACSLCNKIFVSKELLIEHTTIAHQSGNNDTAASTTTPKSTSQQASGGNSVPSTKKAATVKSKRRFRYSESLKCTICSVTFDTKELLFEHIMTHNEQELQEAYKTAKAKVRNNPNHQHVNDSASDESDAREHDANASHEGEKNKKKKEKIKRKKSSDSSVKSSRSSIENEESADDPLRATITRTTPGDQQVVDLAGMDSYATIERISGNAAHNKPITICPCHAHETTNQDLQIEMVLLCKTCNVLFRRRDCFEIHYRNSPDCRRKRTNNEVTKIPKLFCSGCPCVLDSLMEMRAHLEMHARKNCQGTVTFICNICKVAFFGVGGIFYSHWFNHTKSPNFVASRYSFPKLSVVSVLEDSNVAMTTSKSQEGFFYIAEHVCRQCRLPFSSEPELQKHKQNPCQPQAPVVPRLEVPENNRLQMIKLICDLCKKYYVSKENFDRHCSERNHLKTPITKFSRLPITPTEQAFVCSLCRAISKSLDEMKEHWKRLHSPIMELYTCKSCNVVPSNDVANYTYEKFERHCRLAHKSEVITCLVYFVTARYVCNICKFGFETEKSMKDHQVVHQKKSSQGPINAPVMTASGLHVEPQSPTLWVADKQLNQDSSRQAPPVYVHYSGVNGSVNTQSQVPSNAGLISQQQQQIHNPCNATVGNVTPNNMISHSAVPGMNVIRTPNVSSTDSASVLRNILTPRTQDQQLQQVPIMNPAVETILIDSRSNSPILGTNAITTTSVTLSDSTANIDVTGTNSGTQAGERSDIPIPDRENSNSGGNATPATSDSLTPQPFEVVLVTDDLSENSNSDTPAVDKTTEGNGSPANQPQNKQPQTEGSESSSTKSFLRVRSIAELQRIKIHLCSVCGLSFDNPQAFEQHSQQHEVLSQQNTGEVGRSTPVQMISPMVTQGNKETMSDPQNMLINQMRQKMALLTPNGQALPMNTDMPTRMSPSVLPRQSQLQQQQSYWFASCNGADNTAPPQMTYSNYSVNRQQQQQQPNILRRGSNTNTVNTTGGYSSARPPPPAYPGTSSSMTPGRPSAIQLPERNTAGSGTPTKRPSGAATRIPQQSLPHFEELTEHRQAGVRIPYSPVENTSDGGSSVISRLLSTPTRLQQQHPQLHGKTYSRHSNELNFSEKVIYCCKFQNCSFRTETLALVRLHEKSHLTSQHVSNTTNNQLGQMQQQQQQRFPVKHVPVSQMPERPRHALPTGRLAVSNNMDKRCICRICNLYCGSNAELIEHVTTTHSSQPTQVCCFVCDYCPTPLLFETEELLRKHMDASHNHSCELCNKRYPSKEDLRLHMEMHTRNT